MEGIITNIQRYSIHDGPGIRTTVFLKGCPLKCEWCHNPETQSYNLSLMHSSKECILCGECESRCESGAIAFEDGRIIFDPDKCTLCGLCSDFCPKSCIEISGKRISSGELLNEIKKDSPFYEESGGGVTFSGGEAMTQIDFLYEMAGLCKDEGMQVAIDTCGYAPSEHFNRIAPLCDLFLYDLKHMDSEKHKKYTGVSNDLILENLKLIASLGCKIQLRIPLMEGFNSDEENIKATAGFGKELGIKSVSLLPYHSSGNYKYDRLSMAPAKEFQAPSEDSLDRIKDIFESFGIEAEIGG